ncbi:carboxypeptidase B-like [Belonocnema kinseyi]|uniref:carboxypeptidase B-like n=1 Tax=Belonocnema kinseyi TaxID=2817044 RepID=UPI00143D474D|nr:carboxypeptidase B-like [Belonocnema kinseyi]
MIRFFFAAALVAFVCAKDVYNPSLKGMQGISITYENEEQLAFVLQYEGVLGFDFMKVTRLANDNIHVLVTAFQVPIFKKALENHGIKYNVFIEDFGKLVEEESISQEIARVAAHRSKARRTYNFSYFPRHKEINNYLVDLSKTNENVTVFSIGKSYEGREMLGVKISSGGSNDKPAVLIDAGIHAREWIAPTTALYAISKLVNEKSLYEKIDWYILPQINPDGYEYSHTEYRLWRKTRSPSELSYCPGVDANRNFGFKWMEVGASDYPCDEIYAGSEAFSEVEAQNVRDFVLSKNGTIKTYLTFHSYGQYLLHPWGYTSDLPENEPVLRSVAVKAEKALAAVQGTRYTIGSSTNVLYAAAGGSDDWVMAVGGADLSYTVELPGNSFVIPARRIKPVGEETFEAIKVFGEYTSENYA